jgi:hypothetical protein
MPPSAAETSRDGGSTLIEFTGAGSVVIRSAEQALVDLFCREWVLAQRDRGGMLCPLAGCADLMQCRARHGLNSRSQLSGTGWR